MNLPQQKIDFWKKHATLFVCWVSELYPLTFEQLKKYREVLNWYSVQNNPFIRWNDEMLDYFNSRVPDFKLFTNFEYLEAFYFDGQICPMPSFYEMRDPEHYYLRPHEKDASGEIEPTYWRGFLFGEYEVNAQDLELSFLPAEMGKLVKEINWHDIEYDQSPVFTQLLDDRKEEIDWVGVSYLRKLNWSFKFLVKFENYWSYDDLAHNHAAFNYALKNDLDDELIETVMQVQQVRRAEQLKKEAAKQQRIWEQKVEFWQQHLNWFIPWISELYPLTKFQLMEYEDLLDWDRISVNQLIRWDEEMLRVFSDRLENAKDKGFGRRKIMYEDDDDPEVGGWIYLKYNYPEAEDVYLRQEEHTNDKQIDWKSINFGVFEKVDYDEKPIMKLMKMFDCQIDPKGYPIDELPLPTAAIEVSGSANDWGFLSSYCGLKWSLELLKRFEKQWITEELINNHSAFNYCLKEDLDDGFLKEVLEK